MPDQQLPASRGGHLYLSPPRPPEDDWIAVVARSFLAVVEARDADEVVARLLQLAEKEDAAIEEVVSAIPVGEGGAESFAVVHFDREEGANGGHGTRDDTSGTVGAGGAGGRITVVARGRAAIDVFSDGGSRRFWSSGVQPWLIATFRDVTAVELGGPARQTGPLPRRAPDAAALDGLASRAGVRRAGALLWSLAEAVQTDEGGTDAAYVRPVAALDEDTVHSIGLDEDTVVRPGVDEHTRRRRAGTRSGGVSGSGSGTGPGERVGHDADGVLDPRLEETVRREPIERRPAGRHRGPGAVDQAPDEETVTRASLVMPRTAERSAAEAVDALAHPEAGPDRHETRTPAPAVLVGVHGGQVMMLDAPIVFGRRPASVARGGIQPVLVAVASRDALVSASHVRVERAGNVVVVTDLRSRNGTAVILPGAAPRRLRPGESFAVPGAAQIDIGDGTIIEITPVAP